VWPGTHLLAKDILKFHAVIWPALLMSAGYEVPAGEFIHGYLLMGGEKMSKTRGNVLDPFEVMDTYGIDPLRFYLFREVTSARTASSRSRASSSATRASSPTSSATW
jgi:methionyl-tRNA synthetase